MLKIKADKMKYLKELGYTDDSMYKNRLEKDGVGISVNTNLKSKDYGRLYFKADNGRAYCQKFEELYDLIKADMVIKEQQDD